MISYTLTPPQADKPALYARGYKIADTDDIYRISRGIVGFVWSGIAWKDGHRANKNFLYSDWCVLDFDSPDMPLAQAVRVFCDRIHIIGITKSHQKDKKGVICDRFRVVIPWEKRITDTRVYRWNMQRLLDRYPIDDKALDPARFFFPCTRIVALEAEGYKEDVDEGVPEGFDFRDPEEYKKLVAIRTKRHAVSGTLPQWVNEFLMLGKSLKDGRNWTCFRASIALFEHGFTFPQVIAALESAPFQRDNRWLADEINTAATNGWKRFVNDGGCDG